MPPTTSTLPQWNGPEVAKLMARKNIPHREALARRIDKPPTTVRRAFDEAWEGQVLGSVLVAICRKLNAPLHKLVRDPRHHA